MPVSDVHENHQVCPSCGTTHVLLESRWERELTEEVKDGVAVDEQCADEITKTLLAIVCATCMTRFRLVQDAVLQQKRELIKLRQTVARLENPGSEPVMLIQ